MVEDRPVLVRVFTVLPVPGVLLFTVRWTTTFLKSEALPWLCNAGGWPRMTWVTKENM
jgi:hypothetical protein